jgi:hypothetical protein
MDSGVPGKITWHILAKHIKEAGDFEIKLQCLRYLLEYWNITE